MTSSERMPERRYAAEPPTQPVARELTRSRVCLFTPPHRCSRASRPRPVGEHQVKPALGAIVGLLGGRAGVGRRKSSVYGTFLRRPPIRDPSDLLDDLLVRPAVGAPHPLVGRQRLRIAARLRPDSRRSAPSPPARPRRARAPRGSRSASAIPFGHEPTPSLDAASIMFCAARPASNAVGPLRPTAIATTSAAPRTLSPA